MWSGGVSISEPRGAGMTHFEKAANDKALGDLLRRAIREVGAAEGSLLLLDLSGKQLRFVICESPVAGKLLGQAQPIDKGITGLAVSLQQPMIVNNTEAHGQFDPTIDVRTGSTTRSIMVVPLSTPRQEFGAITAINARADAGFADADLKTYQDFAANLSTRLTELNLGMESAGAFE